MAIFEVPARVKIEVPDEMDVSAGRRNFLTLLAQQWLNICAGYSIDSEYGKSNKDKIIGVKVWIEDGSA